MGGVLLLLQFFEIQGDGGVFVSENFEIWGGASVYKILNWSRIVEPEQNKICCHGKNKITRKYLWKEKGDLK